MISPALHATLHAAGIDAVIRGFDAIGLDEVGTSALMDRVDTKYMIPMSEMVRILEQLRPHYRVLEVKGTRRGRYHTVYYDTTDLKMYHAHHSGRTPRYKVRVRSYGESQERFLEVKLKTNKNRTRKVRVPLPAYAGTIDRLRENGLLDLTAAFNPDDLSIAMVVEYTRITLVSTDAQERITLDVGLTVTRGDAGRSFPDVVIAELKQGRHDNSLFRALMKESGIRASALSKYCLGIAALEPSAKKNLFKATLGRLEAIGNGRSHSHITEN